MPKAVFVSVGTQSYLAVEKITVVFPNIRSEPVKKVINERRERGMVLDFTNGKKTRAAILTTDGYILLSPRMPKTIVKNIQSFDEKEEDEEEDDGDEQETEEQINPEESLDDAIDNNTNDSVF